MNAPCMGNKSRIVASSTYSPAGSEVDTGARHGRVDSLLDKGQFISRIEYKPRAFNGLKEPSRPPVVLDLKYPRSLVYPTNPEKDIELRDLDLEANKPHTNSNKRPKQSLIWHRRIWFRYFTAYRILIALTLLINLLILGVVLGLYHNTGGALTATSVNLFAAVLIRQEDLINIGFSLVARLPPSLPLSLRKVIADLHHYGGVHIGCAISALVWYIVFVVINTQECLHAIRMGHMLAWHYTDLTTCYVFLACILLICLTALPRFRQKFHNTFERTHRYAGWLSLLVLWLNTGIHTRTAMPAPAPLYTSPELWLLAATTFLIILPWLRIRSVNITTSRLSSREVKFSFAYADMRYTSTCRFSTCPLAEWHAFATIPAADGTGTASIIVSAAGDWTRNVLANPPSHLWLRAPPTSNFLTFAPLFDSLLLVATGAGIGPMLSLLQSPTITRMKARNAVIRVLWCVYDPDAPHWDFVQVAIRAVDKDPVVLDSKGGRPDVAFEAGCLMEGEGLEACMVVSNPVVTLSVVREVRGCGRAAFGAVFDS